MPDATGRLVTRSESHRSEAEVSMAVQPYAALQVQGQNLVDDRRTADIVPPAHLEAWLGAWYTVLVQGKRLGPLTGASGVSSCLVVVTRLAGGSATQLDEATCVPRFGLSC